MNTKLLFKAVMVIIVAIIPFQKTIAQYSTERFNTVNCKGIWDRAIGRSADGVSKIVSYHELTNGEFHLTDISDSSTFHFDVPDGMYINDLEVFNETVYFCGRYNGKAMVGHFPLEAFIYGFYPIGTVLPYIAPPYPATISFDYFYLPEVEEMTRLEVYVSPIDGKVTVAAVGRMYNYLVNTASNLFIITIDDPTVTYLECGTNGTYYGIFQDVAVTGNYVVTTGVYKYMSADNIVITYVDKSNNNKKIILYDEPAGTMITPFYSIEYLQKDEVAISSHVYSGAATPYNIPIHVYDVSTETFTHSQSMAVFEKDAPCNRMLYFKEDSTLLLLHTNLYPNHNTVNSTINTLFPYAATNYTTNTIYDNDSSFNSLDRFLDSRFIATGQLTNLQHSFFIHDKQASLQSSCFLSDPQDVYLIKQPLEVLNPNIPWNTSTTTVIHEYPVMTEEILETKCKSK